MVNMMGKTSKLLHRLDSIEDVKEFYEAIDRKHLSQSLSPERPYTYWTIELYDKADNTDYYPCQPQIIKYQFHFVYLLLS